MIKWEFSKQSCCDDTSSASVGCFYIDHVTMEPVMIGPGARKRPTIASKQQLPQKTASISSIARPREDPVDSGAAELEFTSTTTAVMASRN